MTISYLFLLSFDQIGYFYCQTYENLGTIEMKSEIPCQMFAIGVIKGGLETTLVDRDQT